MTTPPPDALEQIERLQKWLDASVELGRYAKVTSVDTKLLSWLLPLALAQLEATTPPQKDEAND